MRIKFREVFRLALIGLIAVPISIFISSFWIPIAGTMAVVFVSMLKGNDGKWWFALNWTLFPLLGLYSIITGKDHTDAFLFR